MSYSRAFLQLNQFWKISALRLDLYIKLNHAAETSCYYIQVTFFSSFTSWTYREKNVYVNNVKDSNLIYIYIYIQED